MKVLVVGGTGMIGGHVALYLRSQKGHEVTIAGRQPSTVPALAELPFIQGSYLNDDFSTDQLATFDAIVFAAGSDIRHVPQGHDADQHYLHANGVAVPAFAKHSRSAGVRNFVHVGSFYPHVAPELVETVAYVRSRKLAAEGVTALATSTFHACSLDAPFVVGTVPGMRVPMFDAYIMWAEGKLDIPPIAPKGGTNFISAQSLSEAIAGALTHCLAVSGKEIALGDENLSFVEYFEMFFRAMEKNTKLQPSDRDHPLMPKESLYTGQKLVLFEPNAAEIGLLGGYRRNDVRNAVSEIVFQYRYKKD